MSELADVNVTSVSSKTAFGGWLPMYCGACDRRYLLRQSDLPRACPHCFAAELQPLEDAAEHLPYASLPESVLPFVVAPDVLSTYITRFADKIPFAPRDLNPEALRSRLQTVYLPMWLVDARANAQWNAEVGFDYEAVSHQERYNNGGWNSQQVREARIRWEPRVGRLQRQYNNIAVPALDQHQAVARALGGYDLSVALPYAEVALEGAVLRLPDRAPAAAWLDAPPAFLAAAAEECRQAASADHIQHFRWAPAYEQQNWTLLLLPLYATYYLDDDARPQAVLINGQSGVVSGMRRASMQRAQRTALLIATLAAFLFVLGLFVGGVGLLFPPLIAVALVIVAVALLGGGVAALSPLMIVTAFNKRN